MFLTAAKTLFIEATKRTFDADYPDKDLRTAHVSMEYPTLEAHYPGIWVDFTPTVDLQVAGIGHREFTDPGPSGGVREVTRWRFAGILSLTVAALTSLQRDRMCDELVKVMAFGQQHAARAEFRNYIENNDLIAMQMQWDKFSLTGKSEAPGTPWGTDDIIYEITITVDCQGEIVSDASDFTLVPLSAVVMAPRPDEAPPPPPGDLDLAPVGGQVPEGQVTVLDEWQ